MQQLHCAVALTLLVVNLFIVCLCPLVALGLLPSLFGSAFWVAGTLQTGR
jgi:hypothetical protein